MLNKFFLLGLVLTCSLLWPFFAAPYFTHHDDVQTIRLFEMDKCFKDLQIPCRWVPDLGGLYGYPLFNYYAPLPYYFGEIFYLLSGSLIFSVKVIFGFALISSYVFMYLFAKRYWGNLGGVVAGVFYSFAPYHAVDLYVRGAMGEMWALAAFPAIFWAVMRLKEEVKIINVLILAATVAFLLLSHNLSAMIFIPVLVLLIMFICLQIKYLKFLRFAILSLVLGFLVAAFYFVPALVEKDLVHVDTTTFGYFSYTEHFKGFRKLFLERSWGWGSSIREIPGGEKDGLSYQIGVAHVVAWLISLLFIKIFWNRRREVSMMIIFSSIFISISVLLINPRSVFIWDLITPFKYLQFPWRFLMLIIFFTSFLSGSILLLAQKNYQKVILTLGLLSIVVALNFSYFRPEKFINLNDKDLLSGKKWDQQIKRSIFDYLPKSAQAPPAELAIERYQVIGGNIKISNFHEGSNWFYFEADVEELATVRLSQYYFPDWVVKVNGKEVEINPRNELGLITFAIDPGKHEVAAKLYDTPTRFLSNWITIIGFVIMIFLILTRFEKPKRWILYYINRMS